MTMRGSEPVILNGERLYVVVENDKKPDWLPRFVWKWMVNMVVSRQKVSLRPHAEGKP